VRGGYRWGGKAALALTRKRVPEGGQVAGLETCADENVFGNCRGGTNLGDPVGRGGVVLGTQSRGAGLTPNFLTGEKENTDP